MAVSLITDSEFLSELSVQNNIVVKYFTDWCGSCRLFRPKFIKLSEDKQYSNVRFLDVNAEDNPIARKMANITHFPAFAIFKNGVFISSFTTTNEDLVIELIKKLQNQ